VLQIKLPARVLEDYFVASSVAEAVSYLDAQQGEGRVVAGGTELMPALQRGELRAHHLVDISQIASLRKVFVSAEEIVLGGAVPLSRVVNHGELAARCALLSEAAGAIGTPRLRRVATVGGNLASGQGNSDVALALLTLDAEVEVAGYIGAQWLPVRALAMGGGQSRLDATREVLTAVRFRPLGEGQGAAIVRLEADDAPARAPLVGVALVSLQPPTDGTEWPVVQWASLGLGLAQSGPQRLSTLEEALVGAPWPAARGVLADGIRDVLLALAVEHPAHQRLDEAVTLLAACWDIACQRAIAAMPSGASHDA